MASIIKHFAYILLILLSFSATTGIAALPLISTSVDAFRCVCPGETVYLTCSARGSWSHTWSSQDYFGRNEFIEFSQDYDRPGKGKLMSLPDGRSSLAQMTAIDSSNLQIRIPGNLDETHITCENDRGDTVTKIFMLSREPPAPPTSLQLTFIAENAIDGIKVYRFNWELPANFENVDIKHFKFQLNNKSSIILVSNNPEIILPLSYGEHNVSVVAVDRCLQPSEANALQLDVMKDMAYKDESQSLIDHNSATGIMLMFNVLYFMLSSLFVFVLST